MTIELKDYDIVICLDRSGSMSVKDCPGGKTRWEYAQETCEAIARKAEQFDDDGLTIIPFSGNFKVYENTTAEKVTQIFTELEPMGSTATDLVLAQVFNSYFQNPAKPIIVIVITDGEPNDQKALENVIIKATQNMDRDEQIGVLFVQIGKEPSARDFLVNLDDGLEAKGAKFDIVDTKTMDEIEDMPLIDVIMGAILD